MTTGLWMPLVAGAAAMIFVLYLVIWILKKDQGTDRMKAISAAIQDGAKAFLFREYKTVFLVVVVIAVAISFTNLGWNTGVSFAFGALISALAGYIGMRIATQSNARTTHAARSGLSKALAVAVSGGAVMGLSVVGLALLGLVAIILVFARSGITPEKTVIINGYAMGASLMALFARSGGGIYTKGADMGADLVGKVEAGIPEDDPRNPAVIADNVGDNVGDVAGLGSDLLESYVESIIASMAIAATFAALAVPNAATISRTLIFLPIYVASAGVIASILGVAFVRAVGRSSPQSALMGGTYVSAGLTALASYVIINGLGIEFAGYGKLGPFWAIMAGLVSGVIVGLTSEYFTSAKYHPVRVLAQSAQTGPAVIVTGGLAVGMRSTALPIVVLAAAVLVAHHLAGMYGVAMAAVGMLATTGMVVAVDSYGPIADNAGGVAEMAELPPEVRKITDHLDAVGNTTAAIGKGFAIGSAAFAAIGLLSAYMKTSMVEPVRLSLTEPKVVAGLLIGGMLPFLFSSMLFKAVGQSAHRLIEEVRRQFKEIPGLMEGTAMPDSTKCVDISTAGALRGMMLPGLMAVLVPVVVGFALGPVALSGVLVGAIVTGVMLGIQTANSGGAMDNAKKYIEEGNLGGKGSDTHKAAVVGDTVGDPLKDTVGPSINILIKLMSVISLVLAPLFVR
jgi:K(+)-stimulated pyrophosphate-energized sodium pump